MSEDPRRRTSSDTLRSTRSEHSPRATPPLSRAMPHRHSVSHNRSPGTVIALGGSRESLSAAAAADSSPSPDSATATRLDTAVGEEEEEGGACTVIQVVGSPAPPEEAASVVEVSRLLRTVQTTL